MLPRGGKPVKHYAALPYAEMPAFMTQLRQQAGTAALALQFVIFTAACTAEVVGSSWPEIDLQKATWTIPAARMKMGVEHRVPLSTQALDLLRSLYDARLADDAAVFGLSNMAMLALLKRMGRADLTAHGFRSTFRDWTAEQTDYPRDVAEMALAHAIGDRVEAAYRRGKLFDKRKLLMQDWSNFAAGVKSTART